MMTSCANGVAEELFFRGALYASAGQRHPVATSTIAYTAATAATRNPALTLAGAAMGVLFGLQRRATGGVQAPVLTHLTWSLLMLRFLPPLFRKAIQRDAVRN
jgi:membrane protease YdiL (CAAX protease family)